MFDDDDDVFPYLTMTQITEPMKNNYRDDISDIGFWTLSSCKPGNGLAQLRDNDPNTFCQTDGLNPHFLKVDFNEHQMVNEIWIYFDFQQDESYTPKKIEIKMNNQFDEMMRVRIAYFKQAQGWYCLKFSIKSNKIEIPFIYTNKIYIEFLENEYSGKDTHLRGLKIFSAINNSKDYLDLIL